MLQRIVLTLSLWPRVNENSDPLRLPDSQSPTADGQDKEDADNRGDDHHGIDDGPGLIIVWVLAREDLWHSRRLSSGRSGGEGAHLWSHR